LGWDRITKETQDMRTLVLISIFAAGLALAACHTVAGAGQDVSAAGHAVTDTAHDATPH
jgi:entericidin B